MAAAHNGDAARAPVKRSVTIAGHRTSISMELEFWAALRDIALLRNSSVNGLICEIDAARTTIPGSASGLSSAIRCYVLAYYQDKAAAQPEII